MSCCRARSASASISAFSMMLPHGLLGEFRTISLVLGVIWPFTSATSTAKSRDGRSFIGTATPPPKSIMDSYIGKPGFG